MEGGEDKLGLSQWRRDFGGAREGKSTEGVVRGGRRENVVKKREKRNGRASISPGASLQGFRGLGDT